MAYESRKLGGKVWDVLGFKTSLSNSPLPLQKTSSARQQNLPTTTSFSLNMTNLQFAQGIGIDNPSMYHLNVTLCVLC